MIDIQSKNGNSKFFLLTLLGMLTAFGPFVTDMYLLACLRWENISRQHLHWYN